jgi:hypothetical protein
VEKTGEEEGQEKELKLNTVSYQPDGVFDDVEIFSHTPGKYFLFLFRKAIVNF